MSSRRSRRGGRTKRATFSPVVEVLPEALLLHAGEQILVRRGDDADVDVDRLVLAHAPDLVLLDRAEQLGLEGQRRLGDLVEEEGAAVRLLEEALARRDGAGERPARVAEELALEERLADRGAVDGHVGSLAALRVRVDRLGDQLLARAALRR